jgi:UDP-4-amino-4,6-dideoxy-N-acetyl-beta-L-altrosamine N-acetyltransferase
MPRRKDYQIRPIAESDLETVLRWRNLKTIRGYMYTDHVISMNEHKVWFEELQSEHSAYCLIFEFNGTPLGVININKIDLHNKRCHWGFYIGELNAPRGSGTIMGYLGLEFIFEKLKVRKLCSEAFAFNNASIRYHRKLHFKQEGKLLKHVLKNSKYEDIILFAFLRDDWLRLRINLKKMCFG